MPRVPKKPAKLTEPRLERVLARRGLFRRFDAARRRPVVWLWAPPGAGKTTLVASYLRDRHVPRLWYEIDGRDADPATFFHFLREAACPLAGRRRPPAFPAATPVDPASFSRRFFEELFAALPPESVLALDNYQEVDESAPLHELLRVAAAALPRGCNLIVASRAPPPPAIASLLGRSELSVFGWEELKLSTREGAALARLRAKTPRDLERLLALAGGWAAGLVLLLERDLRGLGPLEVDGELPAQRVFDYLTAEVFDRCPPGMRELLVRSALVPTFTPELAEQLTGSGEARALLAQLVRGHFFLERAGGAGARWRFHPLFRAFLLDRAPRVLGTGGLQEARRRAGALLVQEQQLEEAFELLSRAEDVEGCVGLVRDHAPHLLSQGRAALVTRWIAALPQSLVAEDGWLLYWSGLCLLGVDPAGAIARIEQAATRFHANGDRLGLLLARLDAGRAALLEGADVGRVDPWLEAAEALVADGVVPPTNELELYVSTAMVLLHFNRCTGRAEAWAERLTVALERSAGLEAWAMGFGVLTLKCALLGQSGEGALLLERLRPTRRRLQAEPLAQLTVALAEAVQAWSAGENDRTLRAVDEALTVMGRSGVLAWRMQLVSFGVAAALSMGELERCEAMLGRLAEELPRSAFAKGDYYYYSGWAAFLRGDVVTAAELVRWATEHADRADFCFARVLGRTAQALALHELGRTREARSILDEAFRLAGDGCGELVRHSLLLSAADCALREGDEALGLALLSDGMRLGAERVFANLFWLTPAIAERLTTRALAAGIEVPYVRALVRRWRVRPEQAPLHVPNWPFPVEVRTLGRFEVRRDGAPLEFKGKSQEAPLRLLRALVALGAGGAPSTLLTEALWPDAEGDAGRRVLDTTLHRLRRLLGQPEALVMGEGRIRIDPRLVSVDVPALEALLQRAARTPDPELAESILALYRGPLLPELDQGWVRPKRQQLHARVISTLLAMGRRLEEQGALERAAELYGRCLAVDDLVDPFQNALARCRERLRRVGEA